MLIAFAPWTVSAAVPLNVEQSASAPRENCQVEAAVTAIGTRIVIAAFVWTERPAAPSESVDAPSRDSAVDAVALRILRPPSPRSRPTVSVPPPVNVA